ncbi:MAG: MFS transporter [Acetobacteraceae bacterium]|nr:MFS transporter [Acetobacteraceae bacterium]
MADPPQAAGESPEGLGRETIRRVSWRLLPFLMLAYLVCYIDRTNAGFAALQMNKAVGISAGAFGLGGGIFFVSYCLFEVPSNLALERFGARRWIARIMVSWGIVSGCMALTAGPGSFVLIRFLLGAAEAGFFPGVILYMTYWFPAEQRARLVGTFMVAIPVSGVVGSPISAALLGLDGRLGLAGWQWLFILEAAPAVLLGGVALLWLTDRPQDAAWLAPEQRAWLVARLERERALVKPVAHASALTVVRNRYVLAMALVWAGGATASSGVGLWQPQFIKSFGVSTLDVGWLNALPYALSAVAMVWWGRRSDRVAERFRHTLVPLALSGIALVLLIPFPALLPSVVLICASVVSTSVTRGPFWALAAEWLSPRSAAAGIGMINGIGTGFGFVCNTLIGATKEATGSYPLAFLPIVGFVAIGCGVLLAIGRPQRVAGRVAAPG